MSQFNIRFHSTDEIIDFLDKVDKYPYNIHLSCGKNMDLSAKSFLCIAYVGLDHKASLMIYSDECSELYHDIERYIVA